MTMFGFGGRGAEESDPALPEKLAALKRARKSPEDRVYDFLTRDLGVDPHKLPFTPVQAREALADMLDEFGGDEVSLYGNSLGLVSAMFVIPGVDTTEITAAAPGPYDWHDIERAYTTLAGQYPDSERAHSFLVSYTEGVSIIPTPPVRSRDPATYPTGSVLRIVRPTKHEVCPLEDRYIRIGGLHDDTTPTILDSMQPMSDMTGWFVAEEL